MEYYEIEESVEEEEEEEEEEQEILSSRDLEVNWTLLSVSLHLLKYCFKRSY